MRLLLISIFTPFLLMGQAPALVSLLRKTGDKYTGLTAYSIEIQRTSSGHHLTAGSTPGIAPPPMKITLVRSGTLLRYDVSGPNLSLIWLSDGQQTWEYIRDLNEYTYTPSSPWEDIPDSGLQRMDWEYVSKFRALPGFAGRATLIQASVPADKECLSETFSVKINTGTPREPAWETLRIYTDSGLVCSSHAESTRTTLGTPSAFVTKTRWTYRQTGEPIDKSVFRFVPPRRARLVKQFRRPTR
jgi:hypothetical protein